MGLLTPFLIASLLRSPGMFIDERDGLLVRGTTDAPTHTDMIRHLAAIGAQAKVAQSALFGRFVGTWDVSYETYDKDGSVRRNRGQVIYGWILDGSALQEIWTSDAHHKEPKPFGTSTIFFDSKRQRWTEVWIYPAQGMTTIMSGGEVGDRIVLTGRDVAGGMLRWSFNDIQVDSFVWRGELSNDEGKTWRLQGENHIHRHRE
jgi:hypothetical protein